MTKREIAAYLVSLHSLMQAQSASIHNPSTVLAAEYAKHWGLLKEAIQKEDEDDAR